MKKITLAAVMAIATLGASAQVTLTGKASMWMDNSKTGGVSSTTMYTEPTSNINISVNEDLGGGMKARVVTETSLKSNTVDGTNNTQFGDRQATVGLASKLGSIDLGRNVHSQFVAVASNDPFSALYGTIAGDVHNLRGLRFSNGAFAATTLGPVKATWDRSNNTTGVGDQTAYSLGTTVAGVNVVAATFQQGSDEKSTVVGVNTKIGATGLFYSRSDNTSLTVGETKKGNMIGATRDIGAYTVKASLGKTNTDVKAYNVGVDYHLSKRTEVGVAYRKVDMVGSAQDIKQIGVGLTHRF